MMKKAIFIIVTLVGMVLCSCNVTRTVTNESRYLQHGDTGVVIQTRIVETYDASKRL